MTSSDGPFHFYIRRCRCAETGFFMFSIPCMPELCLAHERRCRIRGKQNDALCSCTWVTLTFLLLNTQYSVSKSCSLALTSQQSVFFSLIINYLSRTLWLQDMANFDQSSYTTGPGSPTEIAVATERILGSYLIICFIQIKRFVVCLPLSCKKRFETE